VDNQTARVLSTLFNVIVLALPDDVRQRICAQAANSAKRERRLVGRLEVMNESI
jgi:hypothetical protein